MLSGQDWEPVVFHKKPARPAEMRDPAALRAALRSGQGIETHTKDRDREERDRLRKLDAEEAELPILNSTMRQRMIQARVAKKWNQTQLAQMCNVRLQIIQDLESGKPVTEPQILQKIMRVIGFDTKLRFGKNAI